MLLLFLQLGPSVTLGHCIYFLSSPFNFLNNVVKTVAPALGVIDQLPIADTLKKLKDVYKRQLDRFKTETKTSFRTAGLVFHHILKVRQVSMEELTNTIHPEILLSLIHIYGKGRGVVGGSRSGKESTP